MLPVERRNEAKLTSSKRDVYTLAFGKFSWKVAVATGHISIAVTVVTPALLAPALLPPAPLKMSSALINTPAPNQFDSGGQATWLK